MTYLSDEDFYSIYNKVPRLNVDLIIQSEEGILLSLRTIEPYVGYWHLPGGTVYKGETIIEAAVRVAKKETGLTISVLECMGYMEFLSEMRSDIEMHTISIVVKAIPLSGTLKYNKDAKDIKYFKEVPEKTIKEHYDFLKKNIFN